MEENYKLAKWLGNEMAEDELKEFQSGPDFALYEKIKKYSAQLETPDFDAQVMLSEIVNSPKKPVKAIPLSQNWILRIAAVLVIGLGLFFTLKPFIPTTKYAENGKQASLSLPDNSEVVLNSGSEIQYKKWNWDNNRTLELKGEAYFKVAKGKKFEVRTSLGKVTVLGTQFDVKQRENRFDVSCYEGRVKVNYNQTETIITKGMSVAFENGKAIEIPQSTAEKPEWLNNELVFHKESLMSVVKEFERHFDVTIEWKAISDPQLFTGTIPANNLDAALQILSTTFHLKFTKLASSKIMLEPVDVSE